MCPSNALQTLISKYGPIKYHLFRLYRHYIYYYCCPHGYYSYYSSSRPWERRNSVIDIRNIIINNNKSYIWTSWAHLLVINTKYIKYKRIKRQKHDILKYE